MLIHDTDNMVDQLSAVALVFYALPAAGIATPYFKGIFHGCTRVATRISFQSSLTQLYFSLTG